MFNLDYRPESYWSSPDEIKIIGELRRQAAKMGIIYAVFKALGVE